jgi:4-alpha-glucanotransferase
MNTPGTDEGNWAWQAEPGVFDGRLAARFRELIAEYDRLPR